MAMSDYEIFPATTSQDDLNVSGINRKVLFPILTSSAESGYTQRRAKWSRPLYMYTIDSRLMNTTAREKIRDFFIAHQSGQDEFLFRDPFFHSVSKNDFGTGDGSTTVFQLVFKHTYLGKSFSYPAKYIKETSETIYIDNVAQNLSDYNIDYETGVITFDTAPASGLELSADFEFYRKVWLANGIEISHRNIVTADGNFILKEIP